MRSVFSWAMWCMWIAISRQGSLSKQSPPPNSEVGAFTQLDLVVSLGSEQSDGVIVPDLRDAHFESALEALLREGVQFRFSLTEDPDADNAYRVARQVPPPGTILTDEQLALTVHTPNAVDLGLAFGVYEYTPQIDATINPDSPAGGAGNHIRRSPADTGPSTTTCRR